MRIGTRVVIVMRHVTEWSGQQRRVYKMSVRRARIMKTGKANLGRIRVQLVGLNGTSWIYPDEEGVEWARGWYTTDAKALRAIVAMEQTPT